MGYNGNQTFTVFDVMERKGVFRSNPANIDSRGPQGQMIYKGPVPYPKMVYHPEGRHAIIVPATPQMTPMGPQMMGEQKELISRICEDATEYAEAKAAGWHDTPAQALAARKPEAEKPAIAIPTPAGSGDGIAALMTMFNEMSGKLDVLAEKNAELEAQNADLAKKVEELS